MAENDRHLLEATLTGDRHAFGDLVEKYTPLVRGVIWEALRRPEEVEDLAQEVFSRAFEQLPHLRQLERFSAWLCRIATNAVIDQQRRQQRAIEPIAVGSRPPLHLRQPDELAEDDETIRLLWAALDRLEPLSRQIIVLHYFEQCSQRQIARFLDRSLPTIKWRLFEAKLRLRDELFEKLGHEAQTHFASRRQFRAKVMALMPVSVFFAPRPPRGMSLWPRRGLWLLSTVTALGVGGVAYRSWHDRTVQIALISREALDRQQQAAVRNEPTMAWFPPRPRPGQTVRITAAGLLLGHGESGTPELHYILDPWYPLDHVVEMHRQDTTWVAEMTVPREATALFLYLGPHGEGPQVFNQRAYLTSQKRLERYRHVLLVYDEAGHPVPGAFHAKARMARRLEHPSATVLAYADSELTLHPDYFQAYADRWTALLDLGARSPATMVKIRTEQDALYARYPAQPEVLWWSAQVPTGWQDSLYRELYQRFPRFERADEAAFRRLQDYSRDSRAATDTTMLAGFVRRFANSPYLDEVYRLWLTELAQTAPNAAAQMAERLIDRSLVLPLTAAKEADQSTSLSTVGGTLPEGYAYTLRFALLLREGRGADAVTLARRLMTSGVVDPKPYLYLGQRLAGQSPETLFPGDTLACPRDLALAIQVLQAGLAWATPEHLLQLPGYSTYFATPAHVRAEMRSLYLDWAWGVRQSFLLALARCHQAQGNTLAAVGCLQESAAVRSRIVSSPLPDDPTYFLLGKGYESLGRWEEAERAYLRAVAQDYSHPEAEAGLRRLHQQRYGELTRLPPLLQACYPLAPEFTLQDSSGRTVTLAEFRGRLLLIWYDAFVQPPARSLQRLKTWADSLRQDGLEVLQIARSAEPRQTPFRLVRDDDGVGDKYRLLTNTAILIDRAGRLRLRKGFWDHWPETQVEQKVAELLGEGQPPTARLAAQSHGGKEIKP